MALALRFLPWLNRFWAVNRRAWLRSSTPEAVSVWTFRGGFPEIFHGSGETAPVPVTIALDSVEDVVACGARCQALELCLQELLE